MHTFERIKYEPKSVRELLTEMKDVSEFMIDLAYSAALLNDKGLAQEVVHLERHVDSLSYLLDMKAMVAARSIKDAESLVGVAAVAAATNKISDAAADIAAIVLREICIHPIVREAFKKVEEQLGCLKIESNSVLGDRRLHELALEQKIGVDVIAIRRNDKWIINPDYEQTVEEGDLLIVRGAPGGMSKLRSLADGSLRKLEG